MTYSIAARCAETGMFGVAVASSSPAVAARCAYARAGVGAALSQNVTDPRLGPALLDAMQAGRSAPQAMAQVAKGPHISYRQLLCVDRHGGTAIHSGKDALGIWSEASGPDVASGGNLLANSDIPDAIVSAFGEAPGAFPDRILAAMAAGRDAGGEAGPIHSAGLLIVRDVPWPVADLRVDWTEGEPITELNALWLRYQPQLNDYVLRAQNPAAAPSYGVPGDA